MMSSTTDSHSRQDRERQRANRGLRSSASLASARATEGVKPPRRRRPMLAVLAVLLIVGGAAVAGLLAVRMDSRTEMVVLQQDVAPGEQITMEMLAQAPVAGEGLNLIPVDQADDIVSQGVYARVAIREGQLLDTAMLTKDSPLNGDYAIVGMPLTGAAIPPGLEPGDVLRLGLVGEGESSGEAIATGLLMDSQTTSSDELSGGESTQTARVLVPTNAAADVADAVGKERISAALIERGVSVEDADLTTLGGR